MLGEISQLIYHIIFTIVYNTASTLVIVLNDMLLIFKIAFTSPNTLLGVLITSVVLSAVIIGLFKFGLSSVKIIFIGLALLFVMILILLVFL